MTRFRTSPHRPFAISLALLAGFGWLSAFSLPSEAGLLGGAKKQAQEWPKRDFLPPVAAINPRIEKDGNAQSSDSDIEPVVLSAVNSPVIHTTPKVNRLSGQLETGLKSDEMKTLAELQRKVDEADLEWLWQATVERNPVIRFSLEKLATPADLHTKKSSQFLTKTLGALISGATMGATMLPGGGAYRDMGTMAVGNALQNMVQGKTQPAAGTLSATEQIQLAGLIDELKMKLIQTYQDYKNTLQALSQSHETTVKNNATYSKALASKNDLAIMAAGTAYYQALSNETAMRQKAKLYRLDLERLAGRDAVSGLDLALQLPPSGQMDTTARTSSTTTAVPEPKPQTVPPASGIPETPPAMPVDLIQPMEIGPSLHERSSRPDSLPSKVLSGTARSKQPSVKGNPDAPAPLPDKLQTGSVPEPLSEILR